VRFSAEFPRQTRTTTKTSVNKPPSVLAAWQALYRHSNSSHWSSLTMVSGSIIIKTSTPACSVPGLPSYTILGIGSPTPFPDVVQLILSRSISRSGFIHHHHHHQNQLQTLSFFSSFMQYKPKLKVKVQYDSFRLHIQTLVIQYPLNSWRLSVFNLLVWINLPPFCAPASVFQQLVGLIGGRNKMLWLT